MKFSLPGWARRVPIWFLGVCAGAIALAYFAQTAWFPGGWPLGNTAVPANQTVEIAPVTGVAVSEVMSANKSAWPGEGGLYADWAEIYNAGSAPVDITGWTLTDNPNRKISFSFEDQVLQPGQYLLVYLTGGLQSAPGAAYQAPFRLSSTGDALLLYDAHGSIMQAMAVPALPADAAYARDEVKGSYVLTGQFTPGMANTRANHEALTSHEGASALTVVVNEIMARNEGTLKDAQGDMPDWIELYNAGSAPVNLAGCGLSDDPGNLLRYELPDMTMAPGAYLIVFASGKEGVEGELHAPFRLNAEGETVCLTDNSGRVASKVTYDLLNAGQTWARGADGTYARTRKPTPGAANQF